MIAAWYTLAHALVVLHNTLLTAEVTTGFIPSCGVRVGPLQRQLLQRLDLLQPQPQGAAASGKRASSSLVHPLFHTKIG
jgi:hypothetical protein